MIVKIKLKVIIRNITEKGGNPDFRSLMGIIFNILIIVMAFIIFLSIYFLTIRREETMKNKKPRLNSLDMEVGEEFNIENIKTTEKKIQDYNWENEELKNKYNKTIVRLITRDPNRLYTYWEITTPEYYHNQPILRVFNENEDNFFDIIVNHEADDWYITNIKPNKNYKVAIGYKKNDFFYPLAYSRSVKTPADRPSDIIDEKWMTIEELSEYSYRIDINSTLSLLKSLKKRREKEERNIDSFSFNQNK